MDFGPSAPKPSTAAPAAPLPPEVFKKRRKLILVGIGALVVVVLIGLGVTAATMHQITKTLDEFKAEPSLGLQRDPDETGTNDSGNKFYRWKSKDGRNSTTFIMDGSKPRVLQVNVIVSNVKDDLAPALAGYATTLILISLANNETMAADKNKDRSKWLVENYQKEGAAKTMGNVMVAVREVIVKPDFTMTLFTIY